MAGYECHFHVDTFQPSGQMLCKCGSESDFKLTVFRIVGTVLCAEAFVRVGLVGVEDHLHGIGGAGQGQGGHFSTISGTQGKFWIITNFSRFYFRRSNSNDGNVLHLKGTGAQKYYIVKEAARYTFLLASQTLRND